MEERIVVKDGQSCLDRHVFHRLFELHPDDRSIRRDRELAFQKDTSFPMIGIEIKRVSCPGYSYEFSRHNLANSSELDEFIHSSNTYEKADLKLRLLLCNGSESYPGGITLPLPISGRDFESVSHAFNLPHGYLSVFHSKTAVAYECPERIIDSRVWKGFIFHGILCPNNQWSMAISHSPDKDMSFGLLFGLRRNINRLDDHKLHDSQFGVELRKDEQERLCEILKTVIELSSSPALIPTLLIQVFSGALARSLTRQHDDIYAIETRTGMRKDTNSDMLELTPENRGQFGSITNDISSVLQEVAYMQYCCEVHLSTLEFLSVVNGRYTAECSNWDQITGELGSIRPRDTISAGIESTSSRLKGNRARANYLQKRAQSQVQAMYSILAQIDNAIGIKNAEASKRIAEASKSDSTAVRIISVVTMVFLPATFTATLFSTTFFDFKPSDDGSVVSPWSWLFWAVSMPLTFLVLGICWLLTPDWRADFFRAIHRRGLARNMKDVEKISH